MSAFTFKGKDFYLNNEKFVVYSGAIHYFRCPSDYWYDRLLKLKECGFNTVETYIAWNLHEPKEGQFDFSGEKDFGRFLDIANELGLKAIVRPGPYICAEWDNGGLPAWLLADKDIQLRCYNKRYLEKVKNFFKEVFKFIIPRLVTNGGNVLMLQVENEYGSYGNDHKYMRALAEMYKEFGADCLYFTSDGIVLSLMKGGEVEDCLCFLNFGSSPCERFKLLESYRPNQPLLCAEFWGGWYTRWKDKRVTREAADIKKGITEFIKHGYSFNYYMFHGGTNFGFYNGATFLKDENRYAAVTTSYDDFALLDEAGDRTETYYAVREAFIENGIKVPQLTAKDSKKLAYGKVCFTQKAKLFDNLSNIGKTFKSVSPLSMEECGQNFGYILYSSVIEQGAPEYKYSLQIDGLADRAIIFLDGEKKSVYERDTDNDLIIVDTAGKNGVKLDILVENMGHINYGPKLGEKKGITAARLDLQKLFGWKHTCLAMDDLSALQFSEITDNMEETPTFFKANFEVDEVADTFIKPTGFQKGFIVVNGFNIGRYYNEAGPQNTLYVPAPLLKKGKNEILLFESDGVKEPFVEFKAEAEWFGNSESKKNYKKIS